MNSTSDIIKSITLISDQKKLQKIKNHIDDIMMKKNKYLEMKKNIIKRMEQYLTFQELKDLLNGLVVVYCTRNYNGISDSEQKEWGINLDDKITLVYELNSVHDKRYSSVNYKIKGCEKEIELTNDVLSMVEPSDEVVEEIERIYKALGLTVGIDTFINFLGDLVMETY